MHIPPTSATMVGLCMTVLGIIKLIDFESVRLLLDKMLALDSIFFC